MILGFPWLNKLNPEINWKIRKLSWRTPQKPQRFIKIKRYHSTIYPLTLARKLAQKACIVEEVDQERHLNQTQNPSSGNEILLGFVEEKENETSTDQEGEIWINTKTSNSIEFHLKYDEKKDDLPLEEQVSKEYHKYLDVFNEKKADQFPNPRPWDHKIELKERFQLKSF